MPTASAHPSIHLDGSPLSIFQVEQVARHGMSVDIGPEGARRLASSYSALQNLIGSGNAIYGVNTGFGSFSRTRIPEKDLTAVQHNLIRSHAAGVGAPLSGDVVRAVLLLLAASLCRGHSGVRPHICETIVRMLNAGVIPVVPSVGSVGASGDLAPLAHCVQVMIGEGEAMVKGERLGGAEAMRRAGIQPLELGPKEGLALINGTHLMAAQGALILADVERVFDAGVVACAMSIDACRATDSFLDERVFIARNQSGPRRVAARLRSLLHASQIIPSHAEGDPRVQDPYSLRCAPPVLGAAADAIEYVRHAVEAELGAVTDNPLVFLSDHAAIVSAGNFHGMPIALPLDHLPLAMAHVAGIAERRVYLMLAASDPEMRLRPHLAPMPGLNSGLMITQYTAAACCNEIATLCSPASVINIPTCAGMEDYNSFGPRAAAKARRATDLAANVVAIELLCAAEALEYQRPLKSGPGVERAHAAIREVVPKLTADRSPAPDIQAIVGCIQAGRFL